MINTSYTSPLGYYLLYEIQDKPINLIENIKFMKKASKSHFDSFVFPITINRENINLTVFSEQKDLSLYASFEVTKPNKTHHLMHSNSSLIIN